MPCLFLALVNEVSTLGCIQLHTLFFFFVIKPIKQKWPDYSQIKHSNEDGNCLLEIFLNQCVDLPCGKSISPSLNFMSKFVEGRLWGNMQVHNLAELEAWPFCNHIKLCFGSLL